MLASNFISAQNSFELNGIWNQSIPSFSMLSSFESNASNQTLIKDWGLSFIYGSEFADNVTGNLYELQLRKKIGSHAFNLRYTPGYQKEFIFRTGESIVFSDSTSQSLEANFSYKELFGLGYNYKLNDELNFGFNVRFFNQTFNQETVTPVFSDSVYLIRENQEDNIDSWLADIGFNWHPIDLLSFSVSSINLIKSEKEPEYTSNNNYLLKSKRGAQLGLMYEPFNNTGLNFIYESNNSFQTSVNQLFSLGENKLGFGVTAFHDKEQNPFIAGIVPSAIFSAKLFDVCLSGVKYFNDRRNTGSINNFRDKGLTNIINNRYSFDKVLLSVNFRLNTFAEQAIKIIGVTITKNIFPALSEKYLDDPVGFATIVNLTSEKLTVKPSIKIEGINREIIQSPVVEIMPYDTINVDFYTIIPENYNNVNPEISYADFYIQTIADEPDDRFQKAILINGINAWDGNVSNLRFFIKKDLNQSVTIAKKIISENKSTLDTIANSVADFYKAKLIFNNFIKEMNYTSDPRATAEYVQYPAETLKLKGGDCDDLSVCFSSLLESVGIETALIDYRTNDDLRHVNIMFNTKLAPEQASLITENDTKYFIRKNESGVDEVWIPVETTSLTDFDTAWNVASGLFNEQALDKLGLATGKVLIVDVF